jgi:hypothetical protein
MQAYKWSSGTMGVALAARVAGGRLGHRLLAGRRALGAGSSRGPRYDPPPGCRLPAGGDALGGAWRPAQCTAIHQKADEMDTDDTAGGLGRADLHIHTTYRDGLVTPEQLLDAATALGSDVI